MMKKITAQTQISEFLLYTAPSGEVKIEIFLHDENLWLTQKRMAELFGVTVQAIIKHLINIYKEGELEKPATCSILEQVQKEGARNVKRKIELYNLDAIIAVGYRVNSRKATQFRIWATKVLRDYVIKGFALDDERLKNGRPFGKDYFNQLLERIRSIRTSERRIYQKITDIFAECSMDYDPQSEITKNFYAMVQNKFHFAITGKTAAELIYEKTDENKPFMGLKTWKKSASGRILKSDTIIAKNYLEEKDIKKLERTISSYFDYIENQLEMKRKFTMKDFSLSVNKFLEFNDFKVLQGIGCVSYQQAKQKAFDKYDAFNKTQKIESDFDREVKKMLQSKSFKK